MMRGAVLARLLLKGQHPREHVPLAEGSRGEGIPRSSMPGDLLAIAQMKNQRRTRQLQLELARQSMQLPRLWKPFARDSCADPKQKGGKDGEIAPHANCRTKGVAAETMKGKIAAVTETGAGAW